MFVSVQPIWDNTERSATNYLPPEMSPLPFIYSLVKLSTFLLATANPFFFCMGNADPAGPQNHSHTYSIYSPAKWFSRNCLHWIFFMCVTCFVVEFRNKKQTETESGGGEYKQNARKWKRHLNSDSGPSVFPTQQFEAVSWVTLSPCRHRIINFLMTEGKKKVLSLNRNILGAKTWIPVKSALFLCEIHGISATCHVLPASFNKQSPLGRLLNQCSPKLTISFWAWFTFYIFHWPDSV